MDQLIKYNNIMSRYRDGEFGTKHLSLHEILKKANAPELIDEMDIFEIRNLSESVSGITKMMFIQLLKEKEHKLPTIANHSS